MRVTDESSRKRTFVQNWVSNYKYFDESDHAQSNLSSLFRRYVPLRGTFVVECRSNVKATFILK